MARMTSPQRSNGSMRELAYVRIQKKIATGELKPGTALLEVALAKELKMSRTPVREALNQLASEGLLEQTTNRGTIVAKFQRQDVIEIYELREALEVYSVRKAAGLKLRPSDKERWQSICDELVTLKTELNSSRHDLLDEAQMRRFVASDLNFHGMLMCLAQNGRILKTVNDTRLLIRIFGIELPKYDATTLDRIHRDHRNIIQAVAAHEADKAARVLTQHIRISLEERLGAYDEWEREASFERNLPGLPDIFRS